MADKIISKIKLPTGDKSALESYIVKDREAADTRITEAEIVKLLVENYTTNHDDHTHIEEDNN
jgi:hypothetical protein